jgi:endonuclease/exonuclease/phosphatase family metal-dependent hydrolase
MLTPFRLATFNLENLDCASVRNGAFERRLGVLEPLLTKLAADVLCLQEIGAQKTADHDGRFFLALDRLFAGGPYESYHRATSVRPGTRAPADVHNLVIASRWPILAERQLYHDIVAKWSWTPPAEGSSPQRPIEVSWDRPLLYACIAAPDGAPLHLVNLHLRAPRAVPLPGARSAPAGSSRAFVEGQFLAAQKRDGQALEARLFVERLFDADPAARIIVCGDLNSQEYDTPMRLLSGARDEDRAGAAFSRILVPLAGRVGEARRFSVVHGGRNVLLDHILASPTLAAACSSVVILNEGLQDEVTAQEPILGSLHAPVIASFNLTG